MSRFRVTFSKSLLGVSFPVASIEVVHARNAERAVRAAELRFLRQFGVDDWQIRADLIEVEAL